MIVDIHTHCFPTAIRDHREDFFDPEPAFATLYRSPRARLVGRTDLLTAMDDNGVDHSVIFGFPWSDPDTARRNNDYILESVSRHPHRFSGFCCLDPSMEGAAAEVSRCLDAGLSGVGELAFYQSGIDRAARHSLDAIAALCRQHNRPMLIHTNEPVGHNYPGKTPNTLAQIYALVKRFADLKLILAHWGGGIFFYELLKKEVRETLANVYFDTAASPYLYQPKIYPTAIDLVGADRILMGSDYPLLPPSRYIQEMKQAGVDRVHRRAICGENARALLQLK